LWLGKLEQQGHVSSADNYQSLMSAVAKDICSRGQYCAARKKVSFFMCFWDKFQLCFQELQLLKSTLASLEQKTKFYQNQAEFYNMYMKTCLESFDTGKK
jgi:hypothetical protein